MEQKQLDNIKNLAEANRYHGSILNYFLDIKRFLVPLVVI